MRKDDGVSELVGALTLMAVLVIAAAIILSGLVSVYPQEQLPDPRIDIYNELYYDEFGDTIHKINIQSLGGDPLVEGEYQIWVQRESIRDPIDPSKIFLTSGDIDLSTGTILSFIDEEYGTDPIRHVDVIYVHPGSQAKTLMFRKDLFGLSIGPGPDPDDEVCDPASIRGVITTTESDPAANVRVEIFLNGESIDDVVTDGNGRYSINLGEVDDRREYTVTCADVPDYWETTSPKSVNVVIEHPVCDDTVDFIGDFIVTECIPITGLSFSYDPICINSASLFRSSYSTGTTPISYNWNFDTDGLDPSGHHTSTDREPRHTYTIAGTYKVTLTATNCDGPVTIPPRDVVAYDCSSCTKTITASSGTGGTIAPEGVVQVTCGLAQSFTINANPCSVIESIIIDGNPINEGIGDPSYTHTFSNVQENHIIQTTFRPISYTITATAGPGGTITPEGVVQVTCGLAQSFTINANPCSVIESIIIDGNPIIEGIGDPSYTHTFSNVQENHIIQTTFRPISYTITASAGPGGTITPLGSVSVDCGESKEFSITANSGYEIIDVLIDGESIGVVNSYNFINVRSNRTIHAIFGLIDRYCTITGRITHEITGVGIPGIRVYVYDDNQNTILHSGISQSDGSYVIKHPKPQNPFNVKVNCPDQGNWRTTVPQSKWSNSIRLIPGWGVCSISEVNFQGVYYSTIFENVFIYGDKLLFSGSSINGQGATVVITNGLNTADTNLGAQIAATTIYIDGNVDLSTGSAGLGSSIKPGNIYINGDLRLWDGRREIYGDVYVKGNFNLKDARIFGRVFVNGDLTLGWTPTLATDSRIYYTGTLTHPQNYNTEILNKCIKWTNVPGFSMPDGIPSLKSDEWYSSNGYLPGGTLASNVKIFTDSYSSSDYQPSANNVIIVARSGDITITGMGAEGVSGVFFAPNGRVTYGGGYLNGMVLTRDGFFVVSGGTTVTFQPISSFISNPNDYPF